MGHQFAPPDVPLCGFMNELCREEGGKYSMLLLEFSSTIQESGVKNYVF